ncbi:MAG: hypothetical protein HY548_00465 [Elusimicrobia bacterium]|nr:hypothetical protein [Elusimicrobiota bacterium]
MVAALQGKLEALPFLKTPGKAAHAAHVMEETIQGLMSLGYRELAARHAAQSASSALGASARPPDLIREALRHLSGIS